MKVIPVNSSNIVAVGYDAENMELTVQFKGDSWYRYDGCPGVLVIGLLFDESPGSFLNNNIKGYCEVTKLDGAPEGVHV